MSCQLRKWRKIVFRKEIWRLIWRNSSIQVLIIFVFGCAQLFLCEYTNYIRIHGFHYPQKRMASFWYLKIQIHFLCICWYSMLGKLNFPKLDYWRPYLQTQTSKLLPKYYLLKYLCSLVITIFWHYIYCINHELEIYTDFWRRKVLFCDYYFSSTNEWCLFILHSSGHQWNYSPRYHINIIKSFLKVIHSFHIVLYLHVSIVKRKCLGYWKCSGDALWKVFGGKTLY